MYSTGENCVFILKLQADEYDMNICMIQYVDVGVQFDRLFEQWFEGWIWGVLHGGQNLSTVFIEII